MSYRILELADPTSIPFEGATEIGSYDSAYGAMEAMKQAARKRGLPPNWYLVDARQRILATPYDLADHLAEQQLAEHLAEQLGAAGAGPNHRG